jgi:6-phosphogluconolactonase
MNASSPPALATHRLFIGTYTKTESRGIYSLLLDRSTGALSGPVLAAETGHPSFLALSPDKKRLFAINDSPALAVTFAIDGDGDLRRLGSTPPDTRPPASHVAVDRTGRALLVNHFGSGYVATLPIQPDGTLGPPTILQHHGHGLDPVRQSSPHTHSATISPDNRFALVCDLGLDKIFSYALDPVEARLTPAVPPFTAAAPGSGPRHSAFSPDGRHFYVIDEMAGTITAYLYDSPRGALSHLDSQSTLPPEFTGLNTTAEVCVHPNGRFVYGSNRGHDSLAVFERDPATGLLSRVEIVPCGGKHPRHFSLSPDGAWLVCANMNSDSLTVFRVDAATGRLTRVPGSARVSMPVCVLFHE